MELGEPDASGRRRPVPVKGSEFDMAVDNVIIAISQTVDETMLPKEIEYNGTGTLSVNPVTLQTNVKGVFAGGDLVSGPSDVISAIADGKEAAISIDRHLNGMDMEKERPFKFKKSTDISKEGVRTIPRSSMPVLDSGKRAGFDEVELGFEETTAIGEALRCLRCGCYDCETCVKVCFYDVHCTDDQGHVHVYSPEKCDGCGLCTELCPVKALALEETK